MNNTIIDTLSVTFPVSYFTTFANSDKINDARRVFGGDPHYLRERVNIEPDFTVDDMKRQYCVDLMADLISEWFFDFLGVDVVIDPVWRSGRNYFKHGFTFEGGFIAWGGNNRVYDQFGQLQLRPERVQVYFDAKGCSKYINPKTCETLCNSLKNNDGRISRLDVAYDLMDGQVTIDDVEGAYFSGLFSGNGRPPKCVRVEEKTIGDKNAGDTLYVGSRQSGKYFRAYEKGKQLGDSLSKWVRLEVEYNTNNKRVIDPESLLNLDSVFSESYEFAELMLFVHADSVPVSHAEKLVVVEKKKGLIGLDALTSHCKRSYGTLIHYLKTAERVVHSQVVRGWSDSEIVELLSRGGVPARLAV